MAVTDAAQRRSRFARALGLVRPTPFEWVCLVVGIFLTLRYAWLLDDAYVYFKYVDNLLFLGRGLVNNPGEFVEGCSSPAWLLLLVPLRATGLGFWLIVQALAVASYALFWALLVRVDRELAPPSTARLVNLPLVLLTFLYGVATYFSSGTESPLVQVVAVTYALLVLFPASRPLQLVAALSPLVRHELAVPFLLAAVWVAYRTRRVPWVMIAVCAASVGGWLVFRVYYYADLFPNTFYLKDTASWGQGLRYVHDTLGPYHLYEMAALAIALVVAARLRSGSFPPRGLERLVMLGLALPVALYVVRIGGDARHYRYLAFPLCLSVCALGGLAESVWPAPRRMLAPWVVGGGLALLVASFHPRQVLDHPILLDDERRIVDLIAGAHHHRFHPDIPNLRPLESGAAIELLPRYRQFMADGARMEREGIAGGILCWGHYEAFESYAIHSMGLTNAVLARTRMESDRPAHKRGLIPLSVDLARIHLAHGAGRGTFRAAVEAGTAPPWIAANLETLEVIESKVHNEHRFLENLKLAFTFPGQVEPPAQ